MDNRNSIAPRNGALVSASPLHARRLVAAGLITRRAGRTVTTVRTPDGGRGTVTNGGAR